MAAAEVTEKLDTGGCSLRVNVKETDVTATDDARTGLEAEGEECTLAGADDTGMGAAGGTDELGMRGCPLRVKVEETGNTAGEDAGT